MPFAPHIRMSAIGSLGSNNKEIFSYGLSLGSDTAPIFPFAPLAANWTDLANSVRDFHARPLTYIQNTAVLRMVKFAHIGADGKYQDDPIIREYTTPGGVSTNLMIEPQRAIAVSFDTDRRGPTGRGRMYLPLPSMTVDPASGFVIDTAYADALRNSVRVLVNDLNNNMGVDVLGANFRVVVASTKGYNSPVTSVRVGRLIDTVRSRRNRLAESYSDPADVD